MITGLWTPGLTSELFVCPSDPKQHRFWEINHAWDRPLPGSQDGHCVVCKKYVSELDCEFFRNKTDIATTAHRILGSSCSLNLTKLSTKQKTKNKQKFSVGFKQGPESHNILNCQNVIPNNPTYEELGKSKYLTRKKTINRCQAQGDTDIGISRPIF